MCILTRLRFCVLSDATGLRQGVEELKGEVESLGKLSHENVVQICGMTEGPEPNGTEAWHMALEFCESDAMKLLYDKDDEVFASYGLELMVDLAQQILQGLCYIHGEGVTHLDLKPENVLLTKNDEGVWVAKLADFGMAYTDDSAETYAPEAQQDGSSDAADDLESAAADGCERFSGSGSGSNAKVKADGGADGKQAAGQDLAAALDTVKPFGTWEYMAVRQLSCQRLALQRAAALSIYILLCFAVLVNRSIDCR